MMHLLLGVDPFAIAQAPSRKKHEQLIAHLLLSLHAVTAFDGVEVLQPVNHYQNEERGNSDRKQAHMASPRRIRRLDQP